MTPREWSRSRFWLCHFLHNRHVRPAVDWSKPAELEPKLQRAVAGWLARDAAAPPVSAANLVLQAAERHPDDPAFVQSLRLFAKEQQHHVSIVNQLRDKLGVQGRVRGTLDAAGSALLALPGVRFELSVLLLADLVDRALFRLIATRSSSPLLRSACDAVLHDKRSHAAFLSERLTMELADLNFIRRNLRRLRLRGMFAVAMAATLSRYRSLIIAAGISPRRFASDGWKEFEATLEVVVPYRREALLAALLAQRERPFDKPTLS